MPRLLTYIIIILLTTALFFCTPSRKVIRKGVLMNEDEAATLDFNSAEKLYKAKKFKDALINFELFVKNYPKNNLSADAIFRISRMYENLSDPKKALGSLEQLIVNFPLSHTINDARLELGRLYLKNHMPREARDVLSAVNLRPYEPQKQIQILNRLKEALLLIENYEELVYCDIKIYDLSTEFTATGQIKNEIFGIIENRLTPLGLFNLSQNRKSLYPGDLALWKLAKITYHIRDVKNAKNYLAYLLREYPLSEYAKEAQDLYDRLAGRKAPDPQSLGLLIPLSGSQGAIGEIAFRGVMLASQFFKKERGPYDDFRIIIRDSQGNADSAALAFDELVLQERVIGVIGPMLAKPSEIVALRAQEYGVPIILLNQAERITEIGDFVFRNFIVKSEQVKTLVKFAVEGLGIKRFSFLYPSHNYGMDFINAFWDELSNYSDTEVRGAESYDPKANDFSDEIKKLVGLSNLNYRLGEICSKNKSKSPTIDVQSGETCFEADKIPPIVDFEALVIPDNYEKIIQIAPALMYHNVKGIQLIGGNLWNSENIFKENTGRYLQGALFTDTFYKNSKDQRVQDFVKLYRDTYGEEPEIIAFHAFEAASILFQALANGKPKDSLELKKILETKNNFTGVNGQIHFANDRNITHSSSILLIDGNEIKELY